MSDPRVWWLLTFVDHGRGFLGAAVIEAPDMISAVSLARSQRVHPGGFELGIPFAATTFDPAYLNRLLDRDELRTLPRPDDVGVARAAVLTGRVER